MDSWLIALIGGGVSVLCAVLNAMMYLEDRRERREWINSPAYKAMIARFDRLKAESEDRGYEKQHMECRNG